MLQSSVSRVCLQASTVLSLTVEICEHALPSQHRGMKLLLQSAKLRLIAHPGKRSQNVVTTSSHWSPTVRAEVSVTVPSPPVEPPVGPITHADSLIERTAHAIATNALTGRTEPHA